MCPKFKNGVCEIVNLEPEHVIVVKYGPDRNCYKSSESKDYEICRLYMVDRILDLENSLKAAA